MAALGLWHSLSVWEVPHHTEGLSSWMSGLQASLPTSLLGKIWEEEEGVEIRFPMNFP